MTKLIRESSRVMDCATAFQWKKLSSAQRASLSAFRLVSLPAFRVTWTPKRIFTESVWGWQKRINPKEDDAV
jgi:hypothetical protein